MNKKIIAHCVILFGLVLQLRGATLEWLTDYDLALSRAKAQNKHLLLNFTGSDWCGWCMRLKAEVFNKPEFVAFAQEKLVLVEIDFPKGKRQTAELKAANRALSDKFGVTGYPTIFVVDADGNQLARGSYLAGGAAKYVATLAKALEPRLQTPPPPTAGVNEETPTPPPTVVQRVYTPPPPPIRYTELTLKGITGSKNRRLVLINNQTLGAGEKGKVRLNDGEVVVLCREIREDSVVIEVEGENDFKELKLKKNL